jgi:hypothetical protein
MRESTIEQYLVQRVKNLSGEIRKLAWIGRKNAPDRLVGLEGIHFLAELKKPRKGATAAQAREHKRLARMGFDVWVVNTKAGVDRMLRHYVAF